MAQVGFTGFTRNLCASTHSITDVTHIEHDRPAQSICSLRYICVDWYMSQVVHEACYLLNLLKSGSPKHERKITKMYSLRQYDCNTSRPMLLSRIDFHLSQKQEQA